MRWIGRRESGNVEDRRGMGGGLIGGGLGATVLGIIIYLLGGDPSDVLNQSTGNRPATEQQKQAQEQDAKFVKVVLADTEDVWDKLFRERGQEYKHPVLVLFDGRVSSACGNASAATGPFYCPLDERVFIDLSFYQELKERFSAPGDFAMAYVVAHEVGHHVQHLLGISDRVQQQQQSGSAQQANALSVRLELQADYFAGVWAHHAQELKDVLEPGDLEEALGAANAIGDDRLQQEAKGYAVPESFTHGTSAQRMKWFRKGYESGDPNGGNTFESSDL